MTHRPDRDATGKNVDERFALIRASFLQHLAATGQTRTELFKNARNPSELSEERIVRHWAAQMEISVNDMDVAIQRAFAAASDRGSMVTSFKYVQPHIVQRFQEITRSRSRL